MVSRGMLVSKNHNISIKTLSSADLGLTGKTNQTHIGLPQHFQNGWEKFYGNKINVQKGFLSFNNPKPDVVSIYTNAIKSKNGSIRSPKIISTNKDNGNKLPYDSVINKIRQAKIFFKDIDSIMLFIFCINKELEPIVIISEFNKKILHYLTNKTSVIKNDRIPTKLFYPESKEFITIHNLCEKILNRKDFL